MTDNMFKDLIPAQQPPQNMFGDLIPQQATSPAQQTDAQWLHSISADEPGYKYGDISPTKTAINAPTIPSPFASNRGVGNPGIKESSLAVPEAIRSIGRGLGDLLQQSEDMSTDTTPDAVNAMVGLMGAPSAVEGVTNKVNALGDMLYRSGKASQSAAHQEFVQDLILPKQTPNVKADMASRMKQVDGTNIYQPTPQEQQIVDTVASIPGVSKSNSHVKNLNLIQDANLQESEALKERLRSNDVPISDEVILNTLNNVHQSVASNPYISGADATKAASNVVNKALDIITSKPQTASSMLDARKDLDRWVVSQKGDKAFNPSLDSPITTAVQQVRQAMNGIVADAVPSAEVRTSLQKQSNLYQAADNIAPKAAGESATKLGRTLQKMAPKNLMEGAKDVGMFLAAKEALPYIPPSVIGTGLAGYGAYKAVTAPTTRIALGKMLGGSNVP